MTVGSARDRAGRPIRIPGGLGIQVGRWRCDKRHPALVIDGRRFCPDCGRPIVERFKVTDPRYPPEYRRAHVGLWSTWTGC